MARFINIISLKPNTGNTTVALNLGLALKNLGHKVIVVDADFSKDNMLEHLYVRELPITLNNVIRDETQIFDSIIKHDSGLRIIPSTKDVDRKYVLDRIHSLGLHIRELSPHNDFVIVDMPKDMFMIDTLLGYADEALIVHSPEYSSKIVIDAQKLLSKRKITNLGVILNKSHEDSVDSIFANPVISKIPNHKSIIRSFQLKHPLLHVYPNSSISKKFFQIAERLSL